MTDKDVSQIKKFSRVEEICSDDVSQNWNFHILIETFIFYLNKKNENAMLNKYDKKCLRHELRFELAYDIKE